MEWIWLFPVLFIWFVTLVCFSARLCRTRHSGLSFGGLYCMRLFLDSLHGLQQFYNNLSKGFTVCKLDVCQTWFMQHFLPVWWYNISGNRTDIHHVKWAVSHPVKCVYVSLSQLSVYSAACPAWTPAAPPYLSAFETYHFTLNSLWGDSTTI